MSLKNKTIHTVMGFDFGTRKIGIAVGQSITSTAGALPEISVKDGIPDWQQLSKIIEEWSPDAFVVGIPQNQDGTDSDLTVRARKFGNRLHGRFGQPWFPINEHLSSYDARDQIEQWSGRAAKSQRLVDSVAAVLILETWFSQHPITDAP